MLLSLVLHMYSMRYLLPSVVLLGSAPTYVLAWGVWRLLSALLPARIYQAVDDRLYWVYQSTVLFFFENYTGVQVSPLAPRRRCVHLSPHPVFGITLAFLAGPAQEHVLAPILPRGGGRFLVFTLRFLAGPRGLSEAVVTSFRGCHRGPPPPPASPPPARVWCFCLSWCLAQ